MSKHLRIALLLLLSAPAIASAAGRNGGGFHGGGGYHGGGYRGGYHGGGYYRGPGYGYYGALGVGLGLGYYGYYGGYYGPGYYGYYAPGYYGDDSASYYYAPPATAYVQPEVTVVQPPANYWYYCAAAKGYFPYVTNCPSGWEAVPAQAPPQQQNSRVAAPTKVGVIPAQAPASSGSVVYRFGDLLFESGKAELQPEAQGSLAAMLAAVKKQPSQHITVEGHTDSHGDASANLDLSQKRAEAVKQFLIQQGVAADHIRAVGRGADDPIADNNTPEGRKLNRRVDVIVG